MMAIQSDLPFQQVAMEQNPSYICTANGADVTGTEHALQEKLESAS